VSKRWNEWLVCVQSKPTSAAASEHSADVVFTSRACSPSRVPQKVLSGFGLTTPEESRAQPAVLRRIAQLEDDDIVTLRRVSNGGHGVGIV